MKPEDFSLFRSKLIEWYNTNHRHLPWRETHAPYPVWVSEVMLQQTQVNTVIPYYLNFLDIFPDLNALAQADLQSVLKIWEGLGYYSRARNLHRAAQKCMAEFDGRVPDDLKSFKQLPGVGDYIGSAVQSIAFNHPHAVVDGNVKRVLARLFMEGRPVNQSASYKHFKELAENLLDQGRPGIFNQAMMELGALICKPKTLACSMCPVQSFCMAFAAEKTTEYPKRQKSSPVPEKSVVVGIIYKKDKVLITRRKNDGLLGGLWEFPGGKIKKGETPDQACIREIKEEVNLDVKIDSFLTQIKHAYTHFKIRMDVFYCRYVSGKVKLNGPIDYRWITIDEIDHYPFPKANHKFILLINK